VVEGHATLPAAYLRLLAGLWRTGNSARSADCERGRYYQRHQQSFALCLA
jgi:hypothetical protein